MKTFRQRPLTSVPHRLANVHIFSKNGLSAIVNYIVSVFCDVMDVKQLINRSWLFFKQILCQHSWHMNQLAHINLSKFSDLNQIYQQLFQITAITIHLSISF